MQNQFEKSIRPYLHINCEIRNDLSLWDSKFGGYPYIPKNSTIPKDSKGKPMVLLAQINWGQTPKLKNYPKKGITQFFISNADDYLYGMDFRKPTLQKNWRILHYPKIEQKEEKLVSDFSFLQDDKELYEKAQFNFPYKLKKGARNFAISMKFELKQSPVLTRDYEFAWLINQGKDFFWRNFDPNNPEIGYQLLKEYNQSYPPITHKI